MMNSLLRHPQTTNLLLGLIALCLVLITANLYGLGGVQPARADAPQRVEVVNSRLSVVVDDSRPVKVWVSPDKYR